MQCCHRLVWQAIWFHQVKKTAFWVSCVPSGHMTCLCISQSCTFRSRWPIYVTVNCVPSGQDDLYMWQSTVYLQVKRICLCKSQLYLQVTMTYISNSQLYLLVKMTFCVTVNCVLSGQDDLYMDKSAVYLQVKMTCTGNSQLSTFR